MIHAKSAMIRARTQPHIKKNAEKILARLGLKPTEAITIFYHHIIEMNGLPFEVKIPNATTRETFRKTDARKELREFDSPDAMFSTLGL